MSLGARQRIVHQARGHELAGVGVVDRLLHQRLADALHRAAMHLACEQQRIERHAEIVDHDVVDDAVAPVAGSISTSAICVPFG